MSILGWAVTVLAIIALYGRILDKYSYTKRLKKGKDPPGPRGLPIIGNALDFARNPHLIPTFNEWYAKYGPIVAVTIFGQTQVIISSERIAHDLFAKRGDIYSDRGISPALKIISDGVQPALINKTGEEKYETFMDLESKYTLLDLLSTPERFDEHLGRYAYGVISRSALGVRIKSFSDPLVEEVEYQNAFAVGCFRPDKYLSNLMPWMLKLPTWLSKEFAELDEFRQGLQTSILTQQNDLRIRMDNGTAPKCLQVDYLTHQSDYGLTDLEGGSVFSAFLGAGTRSPHNALLGFVIVMLQYPRWLRELQTELESVVGSSRLPNFSDLPRLPTVRAVVKESIRYRSVHAETGIPHKLSRDDTYEGFFFPAGTVFHINTSAILSDPQMYPDGKTFNPDRWLNPLYPTYREPLEVHPNLQNFASFGYGRRACPGYNFTELSLTIMIARLAWSFNIEPVPNIELNIKYEPNPNPKPSSFPARIEARSKEKARLIEKEALEGQVNDPL